MVPDLSRSFRRDWEMDDADWQVFVAKRALLGHISGDELLRVTASKMTGVPVISRQ